MDIATIHFFGLAAMLMQEYMTHDPILIVLPLLATLGGGNIHHSTEKNRFNLGIISKPRCLMLRALISDSRYKIESTRENDVKLGAAQADL